MDMDFNQAMDSLQSMFPHFDYETVKTVLAANEGHVERTIEDLMKLTEEAENGPDDDNLFADPGPKTRPSTSQTGGYKDSSRTRQEEEDAKMAYQLQLQYMKQEQVENQAAARNQGGSHSQPNYSVDPNAPPQKKKPGFYKNLKVGLNKLFQKKKKGATKNPGVYVEIEPSDADNLQGGYAQQNVDDEDDSPMPLADALGQHHAGYDQEDHQQNQGGYNQGSYNQAGYNQGNYKQGGHNQGGYNQGGFNQNHNNRDEDEEEEQDYRQSNMRNHDDHNNNFNKNHNANRYPGFD